MTLSAKEHWCDQAVALHLHLEASLPAERGKELAAIPGWLDRLHDLEDQFQVKYDQDQDCGAVLTAVAKHWGVAPGWQDPPTFSNLTNLLKSPGENYGTFC
jgi:hypothetical protein